MKVRRSFRKVLEWPYFDFTMGVVIFVNSILIGVQSDLSIDYEAHRKELDSLEICDYFFLAIYVIELALRLIGTGREVLENPWIQFDVVLVTFGLVSAMLKIAMTIAANALGGNTSDIRDFVQNMTLLRILRLCRMVRAVRMLGKWKTLWKLVKGILNGLETMVSTLVMIIFALFVFACFGVELVSRSTVLKEHHLTAEIVKDRFNTLMNIFLTLLQFVLVDGVSDIYFPMIMVKPELSVYFGALVTFLSLMLANLVTAVLVEDAINNAQMDTKMEEIERKRNFMKFEPKFRKVFQVLDQDKDGMVLMAEFLNYKFSDIDELDQLAQYLRPEVITELYDVLDDDDSGSITEDEFVNGMMQFALSEVDLELAQIKGLAKQSKRSLKKIMSALEDKQTRGMATRRQDSFALSDL
jgi:Ca2+-binding EF-hand superfamily protein